MNQCFTRKPTVPSALSKSSGKVTVPCSFAISPCTKNTLNKEKVRLKWKATRKVLVPRSLSETPREVAVPGSFPESSAEIAVPSPFPEPSVEITVPAPLP